MVQVKIKSESLCDLKVTPLSGVDVNDAAARLQSRGQVSDNNIFEILPRFSISPGERYENWDCQYTRRRDEVLATTGGGDVTGIAIGCELLVFERDKEEVSKQLHFPASVDFVVWRRSILLVGLSSSEIVLIDPNTYAILFTWHAATKLDGNDRFFVDAFIHSNPDPTKIDVILVSRDGLVCTFREIALSDGTMDATHDQNVSLDVDLGSIKDISKHSLSITSKISCVCSPTRNNLIVVEQSGTVLIVDLISKIQNFYAVSNLVYCINPALLKSCVVPVKISAFEGCLFLLTSNGVLEMFTEDNSYASKPLTFPTPSSTSIYDFKLVKNNNERVVKLWVLYSIGHRSKMENYLAIFGGPTFELEFSFQLPVFNNTKESSWFKFPKNPSPFEEPSTIVEMTPDNVLMYHILETSTDVTLQKLLSRGKYLEAKDLAISYNKDLDIVRKAEACDKLNKIVALHLSNGSQCLDIQWAELLAILKEINDAEFVCNFCVEAQLHRLEWVKEILGLGKGRAFKCSTTSAANVLLLTLKKFYTFELVYPSGTINEWKTFISKDNTMFLQSMKFLQTINFGKCERIWKRHSEEFISEIALKDFLPFFNVLFDHQLRTLESVSLLKTILPFSVDKLAQSSVTTEKIPQDVKELKELDVLIGIIHRQVCTLESKIEWPTNALEFIKILNSVVKDEINRLKESQTEQESILKRKGMIVQKIRIQLDRLEQVLEELTELKRNHSIRILFHDYTNNEIPEVVNKLLYKLLSQEEVEGFVSKYLRPYAERKRLNVDYLFAEHIKSVLQYTHYYIQSTNIPHEERIVCLVNLISSTKIKLECALTISKEWPVPWTPGIAGMVDRILAVPSSSLHSEYVSLYDSIFMMRKQVPYRCVINKYKLNSSKLCSRRSYVSMALLRILKLKKPGFHDDCLELLKHVPCKTLIDGVHLEYIESILKVFDEEQDVETVLPSNEEANTNLRKALFHRTFIELQNMEKSNDCDIYSEEEKQRFVKIFNLLSNESKDPRNSMLCKLKQFLPGMPLDIIYNTEFPYSCVAHFFEASDSCSNDPIRLISDCKKLSQITNTYLPDILLAVGAYFTQEGLTGCPTALVWKIVEHIVKTPLNLDVNNTSLNQEMLQNAAYQISSVLMFQCPELSLEQMENLQEFLCRICSSFDKLCIDIGQKLCFLRIFFGLKEQEIPLEYDFLEIYKWLSGRNSAWEFIRSKLNLIGETLLKFGEKDLCCCIFKSVTRHLQLCFSGPGVRPDVAEHYNGIIRSIEKMKADLWEQGPTNDSGEVNSQMLKLVRDLNDAGIRVNVYALKNRNKLKLVERLLSQEAYTLAAELAITFRFYDNHAIWSRILEGLVISKTSGNLVDLRRVLERIKTEPQLWMLPNFSLGWKKVSEVDSSFLDLCPIPLE